VGLPADAPRGAHRRGCAELFLRHAAFQRSHPALGKRDGQGNGCGADLMRIHILIAWGQACDFCDLKSLTSFRPAFPQKGNEMFMARDYLNSFSPLGNFSSSSGNVEDF
jgi:hypothetical protein